MSEGIFISASGAVARLRDLEVVANNLANADTIGFKRERPAFEAMLESSLLDARAKRIPGAAARAYTGVGEVGVDLGSGPTISTGGELDVALRGPGFFEIQTPAGLRYTRAGSFQLGPDGTLMTPTGHPLLGESGPLTAANRAARISPAGELLDDRGAVLGRLRVVDFANPETLQKDGDNLFRSDEEPEPLDSFELLPGSVERSNVEPMRELASLMVLQRAFDAAMRSLTADDQVTRQLIQEVSG